MKKLNSCSVFANVMKAGIEHLPEEIRVVALSPASDVEAIVKKEFENLPIRLEKSEANCDYRATAYAVFEEDETRCFEFKSSVVENIAEETFGFFFSENSFLFKSMLIIKIDVFMVESSGEKFGKPKHVRTCVFYGA